MEMKLSVIVADLEAQADPKYRSFNESLIPGSEHTSLGVRMPVLRSMAKEICRSDWRSFLRETEGQCLHELRMLRGMVIAGADCPYSETLEMLRAFVPEIDNWAVCDSLCASLKKAKRHLPETWDFLQPYLKSDSEFAVRFALVMLLDHFVAENYIDRVLRCYAEASHPGYYVKMAAAWGLSVCFVKFRDPTLALFQRQTLSPWVQNKAIQKCRESFRVSPEDKALLQSLRRESSR